MTGLSITIRDQTHQMEDRLTVSVRVASGQGEMETVWEQPMYGLQTDYLDTLVEAVVRAWHHMATPRDVARAAAATHKLARRHARAHERQGVLRGV